MHNEVRSDFVELCVHTRGKLEIVCFYEQKRTSVWEIIGGRLCEGMANLFVVSDGADDIEICGSSTIGDHRRFR